MSKQQDLGQYPTPAWVAEALVQQYFPALSSSDFVVEPACGPGAFLAALPSQVPALGVDIDPLMVEKARKLSGRTVLTGDFSTMELPRAPTHIVGNPPFIASVIDQFLARAHRDLPMDGIVGFVLPAYLFQTASRVASYAEKWTLAQDFIPRNVFPGLSKPLVFARFIKERQRRLIGFSLYLEVADVHGLAEPYKSVLGTQEGASWREVVQAALRKLGGQAELQAIYQEIEGRRPSRTSFWKEQVRRTLRRYGTVFEPLTPGRYALRVAHPT